VFSTAKMPEAIWPYDSAILAWEFLFCSGQIWLNPETMEIVDWWVGEETKQACKNVLTILTKNSFSLEDIIKTNIYLRYIWDIQKINGIYEDYFISKPACSVVEVSNLPKNALIEIEVVARKSK
jgi:2-iminobutanoate/2-iminopropanoate deaminase